MKNQLRRTYKQLRAQLSPQQVQHYSQQIANRLFSLPLWQNSHTVMLYQSLQNEVATAVTYVKCWQEQNNMLLPICMPQNGLMEMSLLPSFQQLVPNHYGIAELPPASWQLIPPEEIDLAVIPGIAFDTFGNRLGFGAGYYDRYLLRLRADVKRVALAYQCQIHNGKLPTDAHDLPMDYILTETQIYRFC